ncbi:uncharacterized protein FOMMEDRAFT_159616 [Fomitiporia mediterranea MF3/22]|uniref:uncharacterized protein n=1 Tax=Fomitiporia mediterranea (strain MF3/22) TaxID=694068 RepID=UPI00044087A2|nr:uncharacterized protein FOMMEDRAFT_159616 [Fomitiporia mediterranea MF3/22]EJD00035.1 hypothetical protein FOMMEDRAFT_159616 [Fomitiporia mediterranea MF3/22]
MASQRDVGLAVLYGTVELVCQTFFYGVFCIMMPVSLQILLRRGLKSRTNKIMFSATIFMFCTTTGYWIGGIASVISLIKSRLLSPRPQDPAISLPLFRAIVLLNYIVTDGVVIWRAAVLCRDTGRKTIVMSIVFLICASVSILLTIALRIGTTILGSDRSARLDAIVEVTQVVNLALSFLANLSATSIVCVKAWRYRKDLGQGFNRRTKVERIFIILIESGLLYCSSGILAIIASVIRLPHGTLGDIYTRIHVQIAGIYPTIVLVLISQQRTLEEGVFSAGGMTDGVHEAPVESMNFRNNPALTGSTMTAIDHNEWAIDSCISGS